MMIKYYVVYDVSEDAIQCVKASINRLVKALLEDDPKQQIQIGAGVYAILTKGKTMYDALVSHEGVCSIGEAVTGIVVTFTGSIYSASARVMVSAEPIWEKLLDSPLNQGGLDSNGGNNENYISIKSNK